MATASPTPTPKDNDVHMAKEPRLTSSPDPIAPKNRSGTDLEAPVDPNIQKFAQACSYSFLFWKYHTHEMSLSDKLPLSVQASVDSWQKGASSLAVIVSASLQRPSTSYRRTDKLVVIVRLHFSPEYRYPLFNPSFRVIIRPQGIQYHGASCAGSCTRECLST